jgi:hypothetical protein
VLLVAIPALAATTSTAEVAATLVLNPAQLEFGQHEGYDLVSIEGAVHTTTPAEPMLPAFHVQLLLPPGSDCRNIETEVSGTVRIPGRFDIVPAPRPVRLSRAQVAETPQPSMHIYGSALPYPRSVARLAGVGSIGGFRVATIVVTPLQYIPATGELLLHTHIEVSAATEPSGGAEGRQSSADPGLAIREAVRNMVANDKAISDYAAAQLAGGTRASDVEYLIVCPAEFVDEFTPLAEWKTRKGVPAEIVSVDDIISNPEYDGTDDPERIRHCIAHYASAHGTEWVLLGGDTERVPARTAHDFFFDQGLPCDLYYADLDGTWDDDGDGLWGEPGEDNVDMYSDVFVGRAPVETDAEAATFVARTLAYEGAAFSVSTNHQREMLLLGEIMWDDPDPYTDGGVALDMIEEQSVPPRFDPVTKLYESEGTLSSAAAAACLGSGTGIVIHQGHGNIDKLSLGPEDLTIADLDALSNGDRGGLWYSVGCWSAAIDHDTFGEHWLNNSDGGGFAYVGNSRYGWGCPGYPGQCVSDLYSREFFASLFGKELYHAGLVHADAKHQFVGTAGSDDYMRYAMYELNLLGDPETPVWTDEPATVSVSHPEIVVSSAGTAEINVVVTEGGVPLENARVCLSSSDFDAYAVGHTDGAGGVTLAPTVEGSCELSVTVTAQNCVPHGSSVTVVDGETGADDTHVAIDALRQNSPNPFRAATSISFNLSERSRVSVNVYDVAGRRVRTLMNRTVSPGAASLEWDGRNDAGDALPSGTYFVRMQTGSKLFERKMTLLR